MKTSEEAPCTALGDDVTCEYEWYTENLPTVESFSTEYESTTYNDFIMTITGSGFGTDTSSVELYIDGQSQSVQSLTDTTVIFKLDNLLTYTSSSISFYTAEGIP